MDISTRSKLGSELMVKYAHPFLLAIGVTSFLSGGRHAFITKRR